MELAGLIVRDLSETRLPAPSEAWVLRLCESGAVAAAEDGLLEEEDLAYFSSVEGDPDSLGRAAVSGGVRGWRERPGTARAFVTVEILDRDAADGLGVERGSLVVALRSGAGDLGDVTREAHRRRILARVDEFGVGREPVAAPLDSGEAQDLISAAGAAANFADARMALVVHAARRAVLEVVGEARISAAWRMGGLESSGEGGSFAHRMGLAAVADGRAFVSISPTGGEIGCGAGKMWSSVPSFGVAARTDGRDVWEEAGVLRRWSRLAASEDRG